MSNVRTTLSTDGEVGFINLDTNGCIKTKNDLENVYLTYVVGASIVGPGELLGWILGEWEGGDEPLQIWSDGVLRCLIGGNSKGPASTILPGVFRFNESLKILGGSPVTLITRNPVTFDVDKEEINSLSGSTRSRDVLKAEKKRGYKRVGSNSDRS